MSKNHAHLKSSISRTREIQKLLDYALGYHGNQYLFKGHKRSPHSGVTYLCFQGVLQGLRIGVICPRPFVCQQFNQRNAFNKKKKNHTLQVLRKICSCETLRFVRVKRFFRGYAYMLNCARAKHCKEKSNQKVLWMDVRMQYGFMEELAVSCLRMFSFHWKHHPYWCNLCYTHFASSERDCVKCFARFLHVKRFFQSVRAQLR